MWLRLIRDGVLRGENRPAELPGTASYAPKGGRPAAALRTSSRAA